MGLRCPCHSTALSLVFCRLKLLERPYHPSCISPDSIYYRHNPIYRTNGTFPAETLRLDRVVAARDHIAVWKYFSIKRVVSLQGNICAQSPFGRMKWRLIYSIQYISQCLADGIGSRPRQICPGALRVLNGFDCVKPSNSSLTSIQDTTTRSVGEPPSYSVFSYRIHEV